MTEALKSIKLNGKHIGNLSRTPTGWVAYSAIAKVYVNGPAQKMTANNRQFCINWLEVIAENVESR